MIVLMMLPMSAGTLHLEARSHPRSIPYEVIQYLGYTISNLGYDTPSDRPDSRSVNFGSQDSVLDPEVWVDISPNSPREVGMFPYRGSAFGGPLKRCKVFLGMLPLPLASAARPDVEDVEGPA
jgi:hypothetical protein